jgi:predicted nucleotidyltransferase component of viral defense system
VTKAPTNIAASVRQRLLRLAKERGDDFQTLLIRYANERLLYRLSKSAHGSRFVLKGAALFTLWTGAPHRATRDVDLLGFGDPSEDHVQSIFVEALTLDVQDDGVTFDADSLAVGPIREDQDYGGVRITLTANVTTAKLRLQVDIGFGDAVTPEAAVVDFPALLEFPAPRLLAYPRETVVAEKVEAMVQLGLANSRMKDFYDLVVLSRMFPFDGELLVRAIRATFERRGTPLPHGLPVALTAEFAEDVTKNTQWTAFVRKAGGDDLGSLWVVVRAVAAFVERPLRAAGARATFREVWPPSGPWR